MVNLICRVKGEWLHEQLHHVQHLSTSALLGVACEVRRPFRDLLVPSILPIVSARSDTRFGTGFAFVYDAGVI
ncbi:hypothetical protein BD310DRAFT_559061 [Dichomitus squalens]|uniref:Uncharacterized protein n=1 Tax=Dichomitus squalens TaxID=114155 RepID=A0A4Q9PSB6_9APHY|nr:hypothetical protein BD310DRAFT_559061 [Dichomitus squalens]